MYIHSIQEHIGNAFINYGNKLSAIKTKVCLACALGL